MADDLSLLFRLRAENTQAKAVISDTRAAVAQLRQSFGPQLTQSVNVANKAFSDIGDNLNNFVAQRVPLVGGAIVRITEGLRNVGGVGKNSEKAIAGVAKSIESIATQSGKSVPQITSFLTKFIQIEGQAKRDKEAIDFFGAALGSKLIPELEKTGTALAGVAAEGTATTGAMAGMAGPIGVAVVALAALAAGAVIAAREIFDLTKRAADFQGKMFDLAQQTGLAIETLSALEVVAKTTGGELGSITQAIVLFQRKLDEAQDPLSKTAELFRKFNIDTSDTETSLRSAFNALAAMPEGFAQTNAAADLFGARGGKQVLAILKETNGSIDETIKRLRELGILISDDAARAADQFNDDLALLEFQLRGLTAIATADLIPAVAELIRVTGELVQAARPIISLLGTLTTLTVRAITPGLKLISDQILLLTGNYKELAKAAREAKEAQEIQPLKIPEVGPVPLPRAPSQQQVASEAVSQAEAVAAAVKRAVASHGQQLDQLFQVGRINRQQQTESAIADIQREAKAESDRIDALIAKRNEEFKVARDLQGRESEAARKIAEDVQKLQTEQLEKQTEAQRKISDLRFRALQEAADTAREEAQFSTDTVVKELDRGIAALQDRLAREDLSRKESLTSLEQLEQAKIEVQILGLERQREIGRLSVDEQRKVNAQIRSLQQDLDLLRDEQERRRQERQRQLSQRTIGLVEGTLDTQLEILRLRGASLIATENALADLRVQTHESAAKRILKINLDLIDAELEAVKARFAAAEKLPDENESLRLRVELTNQSKILIEQRKAIEAAGNRDIEAGRQQDLENARRYADELEEINKRIKRIERDAAEEVIRLMIASFARRKDIIRAQRDLELAEEDDRHRRATEALDQQKLEVDEQIRILEKRLGRLKVTTDEEIKEHDRLIESLERLRAKRKALDDQQDAEDNRSKTRKRRVNKDTKREEEDADPIGRFILDKDRLKEFAKDLEESIVPLNELLANSFNQVADAIGQTVANWVLLGETGPAVMRKILAQALASIAAEAAVNAIKELALGFATLFFNPAESAAHFTAAGLWASIGGVAALAGRGVAGDLFKPKKDEDRDRGRAGDGQLNPPSLARNAGPGSQQQIVPIIQPIVRVQVVPDGTRFGNAVTAHVIDDFNNAGPIREITGNDGNLNRG